jgi:acetoin utilization deacetylase AcuC-like enzyme
MTTLLFSDPVFQRHHTGSGHPECPARLATILEGLEGPRFGDLQRLQPEPVSIDQLAAVHSREHVLALLAHIPEQRVQHIDGDTCVSPDSGDAALKAAGAVCGAVDAVLGGEADNAFCAVRPPGHHATPVQAMGFCLFNNVAVAAAHARNRYQVERIAVVDFDVHHGNGTQAIFWDCAEVLYISSHQSPLYPGTGRAAESGAWGNVLNLPLPAGSGGATMRQAYTELAFPALQSFRPDLILVSAGFDAHRLDPLAGLNWTEDDYRWITRCLLDEAEQLCAGRLVSTLEGGYHLTALARSVAAHVAELMGLGGKDTKA